MIAANPRGAGKKESAGLHSYSALRCVLCCSDGISDEQVEVRVSKLLVVSQMANGVQ